MYFIIKKKNHNNKLHFSYISTVKVVRLGVQYSPNTVWIFKLHKSKTPGLICAFVLHDNTVHNFSILGEVIS